MFVEGQLPLLRVGFLFFVSWYRVAVLDFILAADFERWVVVVLEQCVLLLLFRDQQIVVFVIV